MKIWDPSDLGDVFRLHWINTVRVPAEKKWLPIDSIALYICETLAGLTD